MKILLADKQDITRAGLNYVISKMEGLETQTVEDKADLLLTLRENSTTPFSTSMMLPSYLF